MPWPCPRQRVPNSQLPSELSWCFLAASQHPLLRHNLSQQQTTIRLTAPSGDRINCPDCFRSITLRSRDLIDLRTTITLQLPTLVFTQPASSTLTMILDDKVIMSLPPPPPYLGNGAVVVAGSPTMGTPPPPFSEAMHGQPARPLKFSSLPSHILLQIVYNTFPTRPSLNSGLGEMQRKMLLWLAKSLRLVNKSFYIACMHVLRSTYLPAYTSLLRPFYSSDPFPSTAVPQAHHSSLNTVQRETPVLDLYISTLR